MTHLPYTRFDLTTSVHSCLWHVACKVWAQLWGFRLAAKQMTNLLDSSSKPVVVRVHDIVMNWCRWIAEIPSLRFPTGQKCKETRWWWLYSESVQDSYEISLSVLNSLMSQWPKVGSHVKTLGRDFSAVIVKLLPRAFLNVLLLLFLPPKVTKASSITNQKALQRFKWQYWVSVAIYLHKKTRWCYANLSATGRVVNGRRASFGGEQSSSAMTTVNANR